MPRIPKRKTYWIGKKDEQGRLQAKAEAERKKPTSTKIIELFQKLGINPLELGATMGLALLVHNYINHSTDLKQQIQSGDTGAWWAILKQGAIENIGTSGGITISELVGKNDIAIWAVSIGIAYFMIKQGGAVLGLLGQGIGGVVKMFFGGTVAVP